jgi:hypothetical protein
MELRDALTESEIPLAFESSEDLPAIIAWLEVSWAQTLLTLAGLYILAVIGNPERRGAVGCFTIDVPRTTCNHERTLMTSKRITCGTMEDM